MFQEGLQPYRLRVEKEECAEIRAAVARAEPVGGVGRDAGDKLQFETIEFLQGSGPDRLGARGDGVAEHLNIKLGV
jgi:microcystin degradation protein MlrC